MRRTYGRKRRIVPSISESSSQKSSLDEILSKGRSRRDAKLQVTNMMMERWRSGGEETQRKHVDTNFKLVESGETQAMYDEILFILDGLEEENEDVDVVTESLDQLIEQLDCVVVRARGLHGRILTLLVPVINRFVKKRKHSMKEVKLIRTIERIILRMRSELDFMEMPLVILKTLLPFVDRSDVVETNISRVGKWKKVNDGGFAMETLKSLLNSGKEDNNEDEENAVPANEILQQLSTRQRCLRETQAASVMIRRFRFEMYSDKNTNWRSLSLCLDVLEELTFPQVDRESKKKLKPLNKTETNHALEAMTDLIKVICISSHNDDDDDDMFRVPDSNAEWDMITKTCRVMMNLTNGNESAASCVGHHGGLNILERLLYPTLSAAIDRGNQNQQQVQGGGLRFNQSQDDIDAPIVLLGLVTNLVECCASNRELLLKSQIIRFVTQSCVRYCRESLNIWTTLCKFKKKEDKEKEDDNDDDLTVDPQGIVLAAYMCLLIGCACVDSQIAQSTVLEILPDRATRPFERLLTGFLRLQSVVGVLTTEAFEGTRRVIELFRRWGGDDSAEKKKDDVMAALEAAAEDQSHILRQWTTPLSPLSLATTTNTSSFSSSKAEKSKKTKHGSPWRARVLNRIKNSCPVSLDDDVVSVASLGNVSDNDVVLDEGDGVVVVDDDDGDVHDAVVNGDEKEEEEKKEESHSYNGLNEYEKQLREMISNDTDKKNVMTKKKRKTNKKTNKTIVHNDTLPTIKSTPRLQSIMRMDSLSSLGSSSSSCTTTSCSTSSSKKRYGRRKRKRNLDEISLWEED
jgi:hypothetical protein